MVFFYSFFNMMVFLLKVRGYSQDGREVEPSDKRATSGVPPGCSRLLCGERRILGIQTSVDTLVYLREDRTFG